MGLDQWAYEINETGERIELAYWRKHPNLHGWMEKEWRHNGETTEFNCEDLELNAFDLDRLEDSIMQGKLPSTTGFFFGEDSDEFYREEDLKFIKAARKAIAKGNKVIYKAWW
jgi:hypothetical protein